MFASPISRCHDSLIAMAEARVVRYIHEKQIGCKRWQTKTFIEIMQNKLNMNIYFLLIFVFSTAKCNSFHVVKHGQH